MPNHSTTLKLVRIFNWNQEHKHTTIFFASSEAVTVRGVKERGGTENHKKEKKQGTSVSLTPCRDNQAAGHDRDS